jgi:hypothetical protein
MCRANGVSLISTDGVSTLCLLSMIGLSVLLDMAAWSLAIFSNLALLVSDVGFREFACQ